MSFVLTLILHLANQVLCTESVNNDITAEKCWELENMCSRVVYKLRSRCLCAYFSHMSKRFGEGFLHALNRKLAH